MSMEAICGGCGAQVPDTVRDCPSCDRFTHYPNVRLAEARQGDVDGRANRIRAAAGGRHASAQLRAFEAAVERSQAVVNVDASFVHRLLSSDRALYANYAKLVRAGVRLPAPLRDDQRRTAVEGILFGSWGEQICYAALSLDGRGLTSYGPVSLLLKSANVSQRTTILEENSYGFVQRHKMFAGDPIPLGHIATWEKRSRLAVAKVGGDVKKRTTAVDYPRLLLRSASRATDQFMEVHVWGTFTRDAVEQVTAPLGADDIDRALLAAAKESASKLGIRWVSP